MKKNIKNILSLLMIASFQNLSAQQIPLKSVVEHFTNTKCSICASRNPDFFTNYNSTTNIMYLSIHPSSPYSTCFLSQQNKVNNDARTNYYGVYGGTPRLAINGSVISGSADYSSASLFAPYTGLKSSFKINAKHKIVGDSIEIRTVILKLDTSYLKSATLFLGVIEDTIFQNGGNGESKHFNVLRKSESAIINLPNIINDSIIYIKRVFTNSIWSKKRIFSISLLQNTVNKKLIQSERSTLEKAVNTSIFKLNTIDNISVYPNPTNNYLYINSDLNLDFKLFSMNGQEILNGKVNNNEPISIVELTNGIYFLKVYNVDSIFTKIISINK
jgi:hypothetical protein